MRLGDYAVDEMSPFRGNWRSAPWSVAIRPRSPERGRGSVTLPVIVGFVIACAGGAPFEAAAGLRSLGPPTGLALLALAMALADQSRLYNRLVYCG
jgi:hypothetical protein